MSAQQKTVLIAVAAALVGFAFGALWQYTSVRSHARQLERLERELELQTLEATLGAATIESQRGSYEISRQLASDFFGGLQRELPRASRDRRRALDEISQQRDAMITALSRSDPQAGAMLAQLFTRFRLAMGKPVGPNAGTMPAPSAESSSASGN
jgi:hypothetical protein